MNERRIKNAYDSVSPKTEQKERMLNGILQAAPKVKNRSRYQALPTENRCLPILVTAAFLVLVIFAAVHYFNMSDNTVQFGDPVQTEETPDHNRLYPDRVKGYEYRYMLDDLEELQLELEEKEALAQLLIKYDTAIGEGWDFERCEAEEISYLTAFPANANKLGYTILDLDDNGTAELIISDGNMIYDLYTVKDGDLLHLISGGERDTYELCEENSIRNIGSNGAGNTTYQFLELSGTELLKVVGLSYEANADGENWYLTGGYQISANRILIDADTAADVIGRYRVVPIEILPFG